MRIIIIAIKMEFVLASCVRGHHVYKDIWSPNFGEELKCRREEGNVKDSYAVAVLKIALQLVISRVQLLALYFLIEEVL